MRRRRSWAALVASAALAGGCGSPGKASSPSSSSTSTSTTAVAQQPAMSVSPASGGPGTTVHITVTNCPVPDSTPYDSDFHFLDSAYIANKSDQAGFHAFPRQENETTATGSFQVTRDLPMGLGKFVALCGTAGAIATMPFVVQ
jgi:hypothetical protein